MELSSSLRSAQRYFKFLGYTRGSKKGGVSYRLREENQRKHDEYMSLMRAVNKKQVQRVAYLDESHIHHNYARHDDSLFDPNDEQDINIAVRHKGSRFCFIAAILECDRSVPEDQRKEAQRSQLLHEFIDVFEGGEKQTKDYHGMFNAPCDEVASESPRCTSLAHIFTSQVAKWHVPPCSRLDWTTYRPNKHRGKVSGYYYGLPSLKSTASS